MSVVGWCRVKPRPVHRTRLQQTKSVQNANTGNITIRTVNARPSVDKATEIHLTISDENLDIVAINETSLPLDVPYAVSMDTAPPEYNIMNKEGHHGGGLAVIFKDNLKVTRVLINLKTSRFEVITVIIIVRVEKFLMANIYHPPCPDIATFFNELSDLEDFMVTTGGHSIFIGNFNCARRYRQSFQNLDILF